MPGIEQRHIPKQVQGHKLRLNQAMRQSLDVLKMPLSELAGYLEEQIHQNPMLDMDGEASFNAIDLPEQPAAAPESEFDFDTADPWQDNELTSAARTAPKRREPNWLELRPEWGERFTGPEFREVLYEQLRALRLDPATRGLCEYLIDCLNRRGYLDLELDEIAYEMGVRAFDAVQALYVIQSLSPSGVGARSLQECLILQITESPHFCMETIALVKHGLEDLARNDMRALAKLLQCGEREAAKYAAVVRALNPIPSSGFYTGEEKAHTVPDAVITWKENAVVIDLCRHLLPRLRLNPEYLALQQQTQDHSIRKYLTANTADAKMLIASVEGRFETLHRILLCIVELQPAFFIQGGGLRPMTLTDVADRLSLHVSTVSRAVQNKYIVCPAGTVTLKKLFTNGVRSGEKGEISSSMVKEQITKFIRAENAEAPLSDEAIRQALETVNICVSRRTVAKYREALGIGKASMRRKMRV